MSKRIILCFDGTWNTPDSGQNPTNVVKLMRAIRRNDGKGIPQVTYYHTGVGTHGLTDSWLGGAFGKGLGQNIQDGYRFLANNHCDPDDEIYIFGFSRGAFTARSLAGFISASGLVHKQKMDELPLAWESHPSSNS